MMFRFTIRDLLWLMVMAGLLAIVLEKHYELSRARQSAAVNERRIDAATWWLNENGYRVLWGDEVDHHGAFVTYPHLVRAGIPDHHREDYPSPNPNH